MSHNVTGAERQGVAKGEETSGRVGRLRDYYLHMMGRALLAGDTATVRLCARRLRAIGP